MKRFYKHLVLQMSIVTMAATAYGFTPVAPGNLKADVNSVIVDLSWEWGNAGAKSLYESFEGEEFPPASWSVENTYSADEYGNWLRYDFSEGDQPLQHDGSFGALVMIGTGYDEDNPASAHQDEWLVAAPGEGAVYLDFWYYLHPQLLEDGAYQDFPDHYYVMISRDGGEQWEELWDGRWDMGNKDAVQQASIFLGEPSDENTRVAFRAVSGDEESLYYTWIIDDISFFTADEAAERQLYAVAAPGKGGKASSAMNLRREFTPKAGSMRVSRIPEGEWLNNGFTTFRVYLDDEIVGDYLKVRNFTEWSAKEPGEHKYRVCAWSEAEDKEYASSEITVTTEKMNFPAPRNVKASYNQTTDGKYTVRINWERPEGDMPVDHYNVYMNDKSIGWMEDGDDLSIGQSGLYNGAYKLTVEAAYAFPEGTSEAVSDFVYPGTVPTVRDFKVNALDAGENLMGAVLKWEKPLECDDELLGYNVYNQDDLIAKEIKECEFTDNDVKGPGVIYSVHAVYVNAGESLPQTVVDTDTKYMSAENLPVSAGFDNGHASRGWTVELVDPYLSVKDMYSWRFDNWFGIGLTPETGMTGKFASISGEAAGMNRLESHLVSPLFRMDAVNDTEVAFNKYFQEGKEGPSGPATFDLQVSFDNGETWEPVQDLRVLDNGACVCRLPENKGAEARVRFSFLGRMSGNAAVDNIEVRAADGSGVSEITDGNDFVDVYSADGILISRGVDAKEINLLPSGVYIVRSGLNEARKVIVK